MLDRHEAGNGRNELDPARRDAQGAPLADRPMADREVPLPGTAGGSALALNQWLDGDLAEADARRADAKQVDLWNRIGAETDRRRRMTTPAYVADRIMAALPDTQVDAQLATSTVVRNVIEVSPAATSTGVSMPMVVAIGAGFFTLGLIAGNVFFG